MATFQYVKGAPVPSARGYRLAKKLSNGSYEEIDEKMTRQGFPYAGTISKDGTHAPPSEIFSTVTLGDSFDITPIAKFSAEGPKYYIRVKGKMNVDTYQGASSNVPFQGTKYLTEPDTFSFSYTGLGYDSDRASETYGWVYLDSTAGKIPVFDLTGSDVISVGLADVVTVFHADLKFRRTDFIEIDALTDDLYDESKRRVCVGKFAPVGSETPVYKLAFYSDMDYTKCVKAMTYEQVKSFFAGTEKPYLTAAEVKTLSQAIESGQAEAKYVIFTSNKPTSGEDQVSVGIYFPLYGQYTQLVGEASYNLAVQAIGDGITFADSDYSDAKTYTPQS